MKYNFNLKNVQIQNVASVEELEVNVEYSVGEIPEILSHVLPFIERVGGEIIPKLMDKFVDTRAKIQEIDEAGEENRAAEESRASRAAERIAEQMAEKLVADQARKTLSEFLEEAGFEQSSREDRMEKFRHEFADFQKSVAIMEQLQGRSPQQATLGDLLRQRLQEQSERNN